MRMYFVQLRIASPKNRQNPVKAKYESFKLSINN